MNVLEALTSETGEEPTPRQIDNAETYGGLHDPETIASIPAQIETMRRQLLRDHGVIASAADVALRVDTRGWQYAEDGGWRTGSAAAALASLMEREEDPYRLLTARLYDEAFGRMPDEAGLVFWTEEARKMFRAHLVPGFLAGATPEDRARAMEKGE